MYGVYLVNPYGVDICFVVGEVNEGDWSHLSRGYRL